MFASSIQQKPGVKSLSLIIATTNITNHAFQKNIFNCQAAHKIIKSAIHYYLISYMKIQGKNRQTLFFVFQYKPKAHHTRTV